MILLEEKTTKKVPGETSLFVTFDFNPIYVDLVKSCAGSNYDKKNKTWEVPSIYLSKLLDGLTLYDSIELKLLKDKRETNLTDNSYKLIKHEYQPFDYQEEGIRYGLSHDKWLLLDAPGLGKAFSLDTPILTPQGYVPMKNIQVGDSVYDEKGNICKVTATYFHPDLEMYRITFSDNTSVDCCKDHLWEFTYRKMVHIPNSLKCRSKKTSRVDTTEWLFNHNYKRNQVYIPICDPVNFPKQNLPIDPYLLGCLLGDGAFAPLGAVTLTSADEFIAHRLAEVLPAECEIKKGTEKGKTSTYRIIRKGNSSNNYLSSELRKLGLIGTKSRTKFIPEIYKYTSVEDRIQLIQGLMDTDGYVSNPSVGRNGKEYPGVLQYTTISPRLFEDFVEVIESLGGLVKKNIRDSFCYNSNEGVKNCGLRYTGTILYKNPKELVSLPRKLQRINPRKASFRRKIINIQKIDNAPGKCITVDSPNHLYLAKNCIVTHNTTQAIYLAEELKKRDKISHCLVVCGVNTLKENWRKEILKFSKLSCTILGEKISKTGKRSIGSVKERLAHLKKPIKEFFVITNIETLRQKDIIEAINKGPNSFDLIVIDEIHRVKDPTSQAGKGVLNLNKSKYKVGATGTLIMNNPLDAYVPLKWIGVENSTYTNFKYFYCNFGGPFHNILCGFKNTEVLKEMLEKHSLRRTKDILNLPPKTIVNEYVEMETTQHTFYENIKKGVKEQVDKVKLSTASMLALLIRLRQATACPSILTTESIPSAKIDRACDLVEEIVGNEESVVVFSTFKETVTELQKRLEKYKPLIGTGDIKDDIISQNVDIFQKDPDRKVFIGTWQKIGTGLTLTKASYEIFIDVPYTNAAYVQAQDRCYRIGTNRNVTIYHLITEGTVDERVLEIVEDKEALSDFIVDDKISAKGLKSLQKYIEELE